MSGPKMLTRRALFAGLFAHAPVREANLIRPRGSKLAADPRRHRRQASRQHTPIDGRSSSLARARNASAETLAFMGNRHSAPGPNTVRRHYRNHARLSHKTPRRAPWIRSKVGLRKAPRRSSRAARRSDVAPLSGSGTHLRERAAACPRRLCATASRESGSRRRSGGGRRAVVSQDDTQDGCVGFGSPGRRHFGGSRSRRACP
jgi:hypothetical protein